MTPSHHRATLVRTLVAMGTSVAVGAVGIAAPHQAVATEPLSVSFADFGTGGYLRADASSWTVAKTADKERYAPGEEATYTITATPTVVGDRWFEFKAVAQVDNNTAERQTFTVNLSVPGAENCHAKESVVEPRGYAHVGLKCSFGAPAQEIPFPETGEITLSLGDQRVSNTFRASDWKTYQVVGRGAILKDPMRPGGTRYLHFPKDNTSAVVDTYKAVVGADMTDLAPGECRPVTNTATLYEDEQRPNAGAAQPGVMDSLTFGEDGTHGLGREITKTSHTVQVCGEQAPSRPDIKINNDIAGELTRTHDWSLEKQGERSQVVAPGENTYTITVTEGTPVDSD